MKQVTVSVPNQFSDVPVIAKKTAGIVLTGIAVGLGYAARQVGHAANFVNKQEKPVKQVKDDNQPAGPSVEGQKV